MDDAPILRAFGLSSLRFRWAIRAFPVARPDRHLGFAPGVTSSHTAHGLPGRGGLVGGGLMSLPASPMPHAQGRRVLFGVALVCLLTASQAGVWPSAARAA